MNPEATKQLIQDLIDAERRGYTRGHGIGYSEGWAACEAKYRRERDEIGQRLDEAGVGEEARGE